MKRLIVKFAFLFFVTALAPWITGCQCLKENTITGRLWDDDFLNNHYEPAPNPNVKLFSRADGRDVLVLYDEEREKTGATRRRAYFLVENQWKTEHLKKPRFVAVENSRGLQAVPIEKCPTAEAPQKECAELVDGRSIRLFGPDDFSGAYKLPVYHDKVDQAEKVLLTPAAVTADATVAGAVLGVFAAYVYAGCGQTIDTGFPRH